MHARTHTHRVKCSGSSPSNSQPSRLADLEGLEDAMLLEPCGVVIILVTCKFREFKIRFSKLSGNSHNFPFLKYNLLQPLVQIIPRDPN